MYKSLKLAVILLFISNLCLAQNGSFTGMGNASVSLYNFWSLFNNQAGLSEINRPEIGVGYDYNYQIWQTGVSALGFVMPTKSGNFALMASRYGYSGYGEQNTGISYSRKLGQMFSAAVSFNYLFFTQADVTGYNGSFFLQTGLISTPAKNLQIGAHIYNPTLVKLKNNQSQMLPTVFRLGMNYKFSEQVLLAIETEKNIDKKARFKAGIDYNAVENLYLRCGFLTQPNQFSLGLGYKIKNLVTDVAIITHEVLPLSSQISFKYQF